jgi:hypothetical protein
VSGVRTLINVVVIFGLFTCAFLVAWWLVRWLGVPGQSLADDPFDYGHEHDAIPDWDYRPTRDEWEEFQRMLDDEAQDGRNDL